MRSRQFAALSINLLVHKCVNRVAMLHLCIYCIVAVTDDTLRDLF
jgi:hypothetical protein